MKVNRIAILIALCIFVALASAQSYSIRANRGLNLRTAPSRSAAIADTVRSGTILQVIGRFNRWLKIDRYGREVWLADWVDYSRVDSIAPPASPALPAPTGPIDNCCYVDRQCHSDLEWMAGWHAFQNGQCAAPAQPVASAPANVDNCCYVDRQCQSDLEWMAGWHAYRTGQCAAPGQPQTVSPTASALAGADNCCIIDDLNCVSDFEWRRGYWAFQVGHCAAPGQHQSTTPALPSASELATGGNCCDSVWQCRFEEERVQGYWAYQINQCAGLPNTSAITLTGPVPRIEGSSLFVSTVMASLKWLKSLAPDWYNYVVTGMDLIVERPVHVSLGDGVHTCTATANYRARRVSVETCWMRWTLGGNGPVEFDQASIAAMLAHEACHIHTHEEGKWFASIDHEEEECNKFSATLGGLFGGALAAGLDPSRGTNYFAKEEALGKIRRYCSAGYRADLFCPTLQRLESDWRNVPYAVFPPGAPE